MRNLIKVMSFSLLTIAAFAGYSNFGIPVIKPALPPVEEQLDLESMTMDQFIALGERVFNGKGTCTLCHSAVGGRAPLLDTIATTAKERLADERYQGEADTAEAYLFESMVKPSAYVVSGFGKAGTNDTESPMPDVAGGGIGMSDAETKAVIAYLQNLAGEEVTVEIPIDGGDMASSAESESETVADSDAKPVILEDPEAIIVKHACGACHKVADQVGALGPDLTQIGANRDEAYLRRAILDPNADIPEGFQPNIMPNTYGEQLYAKELEVLVTYLAGLK
ncbi:MAG: c-type cytochrome [Arenicellales bacterium]|nr:c-type cytochrome [Arenicellales bacterium]